MGSRTIVHVDMDAFYASIEQLDAPELRGKPVIVGADPKGGQGRGVVSTCSYEARKFGVRSAMPVSQAYRLCPQGIFVPGRHKRYAELSAVVMETLSEFSPLVEAVSIDEAFLDCTGTESLFGPAIQLGKKIKARIRERTGLTASAGIAGCKSVAKIASDFYKPDGLTVVPPGGEKDFLAPLPVEKLWGVGPKTAARLKQLGYHFVSDVAKTSREDLERLLGRWGTHIYELANAIDPRPVAPGWQRKSISEETTFETDTDDLEYLREVLTGICESLSQKMLKENLKGRTLQFKIRLTGFETFTRSHTLPKAVFDMHSLRDFAWDQLARFDRKGKAVRLIGVGVTEFSDEEEEPQLDLFAAPAAVVAPQGNKGPTTRNPARLPSSPESEGHETVDKLIFAMGEKFKGKVKRAAISSTANDRRMPRLLRRSEHDDQKGT